MVFDLLLGFLVLVTASYLGTTLALRGFFGRERYESPVQRSDGPPESGVSERRDDVPRASDVTERDGDR